MLKLHNNYTHKFTNNKNIIAITNNSNCKVTLEHSCIYRHFLSIPYKSNINTIDTNVLVGFTNKDYSEKYLNHINTTFNHDAQLFDIELDEFKYIGTLMNLPIVIIMNEFYDDKHYKIFYQYKKRKEVMRSFMKKTYD